MVRKIVTELKGFDNLYYEICNEPYFCGVTLEWQRHIADVIVETESALGVKHLISQNIANDKAKVQDPHPAISIFNFHYATPPDTVEMNYGLNKVIGDNETGFRGTNDLPYRVEGWEFFFRWRTQAQIVTHFGSLYHAGTARAIGFYSRDIVSSDWESLRRLCLHGDVVDPDLVNSEAAPRRAALRARDQARHSVGYVVIHRRGKIVGDRLDKQVA